MDVRKFVALLLFPIAAWQMWITSIPNYHLQHLLIWLVTPFMIWAWRCRWWTIHEACQLFRPILPYLFIFLFLQLITSWQNAHDLATENIVKSVLFDLAKLCAQLPFLLLFALLGVVLTKESSSRRMLVRSAIVLFVFLSLLFCLQALYVYLASPSGLLYSKAALQADTLTTCLLEILQPILRTMASICEARWKENLYDFYSEGAYSLTLPRINGIFEEASMFASHVGVLFIPLAVGLLSVGNKNTSRKLIILAWVIFLSACLMLAACRSTTGQILLLPAVITWLFCQKRGRGMKRVCILFLGATLMVAGTLFLVPQGSTDMLTRISKGYANSGNPRAVVFRGTLDVIAEHPLLGTGRSWYLPHLYAGEEYRKHSNDGELALWQKTDTGEMSATLAFVARYGLVATLMVAVFFFCLWRWLAILRKRMPNSSSLAFAVPAYGAWGIMAFSSLLGSYDPRNALLILPASCFLGLAFNYTLREHGAKGTCCIVMHSAGGGGEKMALLLAEQLSKCGRMISIVSLWHLPALQKIIPQSVAFSMPHGPGTLNFLRHLWKINTTASSCEAVVGSLELQSIFVAALFARGRAIGWLHKDVAGYLEKRNLGYRCLYRFLLGWAAARCKAVVCVSDGIVRSSQALFPRQKNTFIRIYNMLDLDAIHGAALEPLPEPVSAFIGKAPLILGVGRLEWQKNFSLLLEAHALLRQRGLEVICCIIGEGRERSLLEAKVAELGTGAYVRIPGFFNALPVMSIATVFAQSSRFEGMPLVLLEALALGVPAVAVDCPSGPTEILDNGRYGSLTLPDAVSLADALEVRLTTGMTDVEHDILRQRAAAFSLDRIMPEWVTLLSN
jgi:Glycosyltransferase